MVLTDWTGFGDETKWNRDMFMMILISLLLYLVFDLRFNSEILSGWSKFTGYLCRVLGKICVKKSVRPPFCYSKKSLRPPNFLRKKLLAPLFDFFSKQPDVKFWKPISVFVVCIISQWTHSSHLPLNFFIFKNGFVWKIEFWDFKNL